MSTAGHTFAVFADPGASRARAVAKLAGQSLARKGHKIVCMSRDGAYCPILLASALEAGGQVTIVHGEGADLGAVPAGAETVAAASLSLLPATVAAMAEGMIALPGRLTTLADLFDVWVAAGGGASGKPIGMMNRKAAFEVIRGFMSDIANVGAGSTERHIQFSDDVEDLLNRLVRQLEK